MCQYQKCKRIKSSKRHNYVGDRVTYTKEELKEYKSQNFKERLEFIDKYAEWLKKTPNKKWSKQQNKMLSH